MGVSELWSTVCKNWILFKIEIVTFMSQEFWVTHNAAIDTQSESERPDFTWSEGHCVLC